MEERPDGLSAPLSRRQFLRQLGFAAGAALTPAFLREVDAASAGARPLRVVIVGAGLAGLCAAYELERRGHTVVILEAEPVHVGGRARTLRFGDSLYGEAGAMRIPLGHALTRHYAREFGLTLRRFVHSNPAAYYCARGRRERIKDVRRLNALYALAPGESEKTPDDLWAQAVSEPLKALSDAARADLSATSLQTEAMRALDQLSLQQVLDRAGLSPEACDFLATTYGLETSLPTAATEQLREERDQVWTQDFHEIVGGTDLLPAAFARRLKSKPLMGREVVRLEQDPLRYRAAAVYLEQGRERRAEGDLLLCTLPFPVLSHIPVEPAFSAGKQRAIRQLHYDSSTKVLVVARRRFWESDDGIYGGGTYADLPTGMTFYPSDNAAARDPRVSAGPGVMLASYTWGEQARRLAALPPGRRAATVVDHLSQVHPQLRAGDTVVRSASWSWDNHRYSGGAFCWFLPGQHTALHRHVVAPEGRIFFAGEHASLTHAWMQGALESALRAVQEMLKVDRV